jgi:outer membrane receptor for ferrienterochelin and colicin
MKHQTMLRKKLLAALITGTVGATFSIPTISLAQTANATLQGQAAPGAQITARNVDTGMVRVTRANGQGRYTLVGLPPGTWHVDAGPGTGQTVALSVASTATLNLAPAAAAPTTQAPQTLTAVQVTASPLLDVKTSQVGGTVSQHQIQTLPQTTRNFLEFADIVPGMIFTVDSSGNTSLQGGAQSTSNVNVYIDGVGQKSYVMGGISGQFATQGNPFPELAIGQYRVITSNYKAEYDQLSSAAVTAVTKSGTNEFHGEVYGNYTDDSYRDMTPSEKASGQKTTSESKEYGFALGGPIIQDKMHFFVTNSVKRFDTPIAVVPGVTGVTDLLPPDAQAQLGPANLPFFENLFFGKLDWEITDSDRVELRAQNRRESQIGNVGGTTAASAGINVKNTDKRYELYWEHSADSWYNEFLLTYENAFYVPQQRISGVGQVYTFGPANNATILQTGAADPRAQQNKGQKGPGFKDDLTFTDLHWLGDHTVKMGVKYKDVELTASDASTDTAKLFYDVEPGLGTDPNPYQAVLPLNNPGFNTLVRSKDKQFGAYIQDDWVVNEHLTFNLGVRWDMERNPSYLDWVTPADVVTALNSQDPRAPAGQTYAQSLANGGVNINDYISTGNNRSAYKGEWQPRLGFSYDINGDERHVIFGGAGRAYDRDLYNYLQLEQTKFALSEPTIYFSSATNGCLGTPCFAWNPSYASSVAALQGLTAGSSAGFEVDMFTNKLKVPYSDQFSIGMRNKLGDWNTSATIVRNLSYDGLAATLGNRNPDGSFWMNGGQPWGAGVPGYGSLILWNNGIETRATQFLLSLEKPYTRESRWGATIAYTYTNASQNRDIAGGPYSFDQATINQYPFITSNFAPKHRLVATAVADGPWGLTFSGKLTLATPTPENGFIYYSFPATAPNGANNLPAAGIPSGGKRFLIGGPIFGYRDVDFAVMKNIPIAGDVVWQLRLDIINAFNYKNLVDVNSMYPTFYPLSYVTTGNITGVPRTFKFTMKVTW